VLHRARSVSGSRRNANSGRSWSSTTIVCWALLPLAARTAGLAISRSVSIRSANDLNSPLTPALWCGGRRRAPTAGVPSSPAQGRAGTPTGSWRPASGGSPRSRRSRLQLRPTSVPGRGSRICGHKRRRTPPQGPLVELSDVRPRELGYPFETLGPLELGNT
jgi:hypothetical protein